MANYFAFATGSATTCGWSTAYNGANNTTWSTANQAGNVLYANGKTVTLDADCVANLTTATLAGMGGGGGFACAIAGRAINGTVVAGTSTCLTLSHTNGSVTINGAITGSASSPNCIGVVNSGAGNVICNGLITGGSASTVGFSFGVSNSGVGAVIANGGITGGTANSTNYGVSNGSTGAVFNSGALTNGLAYAVSFSVAGTYFIQRTALNTAGKYTGSPMEYNNLGGYKCYFATSNSQNVSASGWNTWLDGTGGTTVAASGITSNDLVLLNGKTGVNLDTDITCSKLSNEFLSGELVFSGTTSRTITGNIIGGTYNIAQNANECMVYCNHTAGTLNVIGNVYGGASVWSLTDHNSFATLRNNNTGNVSITGNVYGGSATNNNTAIENHSSGAITISGAVGTATSTFYAIYANASTATGTITAGSIAGMGISTASTQTIVLTATGTCCTGGTTTGYYGIIKQGSTTLTINASGDIVGSAGYPVYVLAGTVNITTAVGKICKGGTVTNSHAIYNNGASSIVNITGNVSAGTGGTSYGYNLVSGSGTITGNINSTTQSVAVLIAASKTLNVIGNITGYATASRPGVSNNGTLNVSNGTLTSGENATGSAVINASTGITKCTNCVLVDAVNGQAVAAGILRIEGGVSYRKTYETNGSTLSEWRVAGAPLVGLGGLVN